MVSALDGDISTAEEIAEALDRVMINWDLQPMKVFHICDRWSDKCSNFLVDTVSYSLQINRERHKIYGE